MTVRKPSGTSRCYESEIYETGATCVRCGDLSTWGTARCVGCGAELVPPSKKPTGWLSHGTRKPSMARDLAHERRLMRKTRAAA